MQSIQRAVEEAAEDQVQELFATNFFGPATLIQAVLPGIQPPDLFPVRRQQVTLTRYRLQPRRIDLLPESPAAAGPDHRVQHDLYRRVPPLQVPDDGPNSKEKRFAL